MHVYGEGRRGRCRGQTLLQPRYFVEAQTCAAGLLRHKQGEIALRCELGEVLIEEAVFPIVDLGPRAETAQQVVGQVRRGQLCVSGFPI